MAGISGSAGPGGRSASASGPAVTGTTTTTGTTGTTVTGVRTVTGRVNIITDRITVRPATTGLRVTVTDTARSHTSVTPTCMQTRVNAPVSRILMTSRRGNSTAAAGRTNMSAGHMPRRGLIGMEVLSQKRRPTR